MNPWFQLRLCRNLVWLFLKVVLRSFEFLLNIFYGLGVQESALEADETLGEDSALKDDKPSFSNDGPNGGRLMFCDHHTFYKIQDEPKERPYFCVFVKN